MNAFVRPARITPRQSAQKPKVQQSFSWAAPTVGLVANGNLAVSQPGAARVLENFRCTATGVIVRRGKQRHATLGLGSTPVRSIFSYANGSTRQLFASDDTAIFDVTTIPSPFDYVLADEDDEFYLETEDGYPIGDSSTTDLDVYANTNGKWITVQTQATDGSTYTLGVNGTDFGFIYDGEYFFPQLEDGVRKLSFDAETVAFTEGETVTGGASGATGVIYKVVSDGAVGSLYLSSVVGGPFTDNEAITDGDGGSATVNGADTAVTATTMTFEDDPGLDTADLSYVWIHKLRTFYVQKDSLNAWYLPVGQLSGELKRFSLGGQFKLGGYLLMGATWSRDTGSGLNAMCAFFSSEGEVAIYQGSNPGDANDWLLVGVFRIGRPLGPRSMMEAGGDLVVATDIGFVPISRALDTDFAILGSASVSENIIDLWNDEVGLRSGGDWNISFWSSKQVVVIALPTINEQLPKWLVVNAKTKAWSTYSGWDATCVHVSGDQCYFGGPDGAVTLAEASGIDDDQVYVATCIPAFDQMGVSGYKTVGQVRAVLRGPNPVNEKVSIQSDYRIALPAPPSASLVSSPSAWGDAVWGSFEWGDANVVRQVQQRWKAAAGGGEVHAPALQIVSGSNAPLDAELVRFDAVFTSGEVVT